MALFDRNREPSAWELRIFGVLLVVVFGLFGWLLIRHFQARALAVVIWSLAGVVGVFYYVVPSSRRMIFQGWMATVYPLGWLLSHVVLATIYYALITPIGLALRLFRYDPLSRRFDSNATTYWTPSPPPPERARRYFQQF